MSYASFFLFWTCFRKALFSNTKQKIPEQSVTLIFLYAITVKFRIVDSRRRVDPQPEKHNKKQKPQTQTYYEKMTPSKKEKRACGGRRGMFRVSAKPPTSSLQSWIYLLYRLGMIKPTTAACPCYLACRQWR